MLYSFFGNDTTKVREEAFTFLKNIAKDTEPRIVTAKEFYPTLLPDLAGSTSLFGGTEIVLLDTLSESEEGEVLFNALPLLQESKNTFILIEGACLSAEKKKITQASHEVTEITKEKEEGFNTFSLTDALLNRDKKNLWLLLNTAWSKGIPNEEIIGILLWQVKVMRLAGKTNTAEEAGQKPFVYQKAKRALKNFKEGQIDGMSRDLIAIYHKGHQGVVDIPLALESWVLQL